MNNNKRYTKKQKEIFDNRDRSKQIFRLRGMKDVVVSDYKYWDVITKKVIEISKVYGFKMMKIPVLEKFNLYKQLLGEDSGDSNEKLYTIKNEDDESVLRPEARSGLVRAYIEHNMFTELQPIKLAWMGPVFRREALKTNVSREFNQFNLEILGEENPMADFLVILVAYDFFSELQIKTQVQINNLGCDECSPLFIVALKKYYKKHKSELCSDCIKNYKKDPLMLLKCKNPQCKALQEYAPPFVDYLCDNCKKSLTLVLEYMDEMNIPYDLNNSLIKDAKYYSGNVFEFLTLNNDDEEGAVEEVSLGGGGRYNKLVEGLGGVPAMSCGIAIGVERTILKLKQCKISIRDKENDIIFIAQLGDRARRKSFYLFERLRKAGFNVRQFFTKDSLKEQLVEATNIGASFALIIGEKEVNDNLILIRDMESGNQESIDFERVQKELEKRLNKKGNSPRKKRKEGVIKT